MYAFNKKIQALKPYQPITGNYQVHLDANESFIPLPQYILHEILEETQKLQFNRYPDASAAEVCSAFASYYDVPSESVAAGNGSDELISIIFSVFLEKGDSYAVCDPDFSMYQFYGELFETQGVTIPKDTNFQIDVDRVINTCKNEDVKLLIFSNPCNPTSVGLQKADVRKIVTGVDAVVVLDEAYMDFWDQSMLDEVTKHENLIILRTCSKAFGMAAIRLGFAVANPAIRNVLMAAKSPYNVNTLTQKAGTVILNHKYEAEKALQEIQRAKQFLYGGLLELQNRYGAFQVIDGVTNFVSLKMEDGSALYAYLEKLGIAVRYVGGLVRITCGTQKENEILLHAAENYFLKMR